MDSGSKKKVNWGGVKKADWQAFTFSEWQDHVLYVWYPHPGPEFKWLTNFWRLHCRNSPDGQDFEGYLGTDAYDDHIITPFNKFLHEAFCKSDFRHDKNLTWLKPTSSWNLHTNTNTPEADENEEKSNEGEDSEVDQEMINLTKAEGHSDELRLLYAWANKKQI